VDGVFGLGPRRSGTAPLCGNLLLVAGVLLSPLWLARALLRLHSVLGS